MEWQDLLKPDVQKFIQEHESDDIKTLGLKKAPDVTWPYALILDQIKVRQKAKIKSPDLYETNGFIFPLNDTYEQASSSACAAYKAQLVSGKSFIDLTAGCGIDSYYISKRFVSSVLVERDEYSINLLRHNMDALKDKGNLNGDIKIYHGDSNDFIENMAKVDVVFIDPQRRENGRKALYDLSLCSPNIIKLLPILKRKAKNILIKTSPFLDIEKAVHQLQMVKQVHVVQWRGECKEVLYLLDCKSENHQLDPEINAVEIDDDGSVKQKFSYYLSEEKKQKASCVLPQKYIFEPGPAFQKAGGFKTMAVQYRVNKIHPNSQLYTAENPHMEFPGKCYEIVGVYPVKEKNLPVKKADLVVRNFPASVKDLKKKLKIEDGGSHRIFATTVCDGKKRLILCLK